MTVAGKIITGFGLTLTLLLGVLIYDLSLLRDLAEIQQDLSAVSFQASMIALALAALPQQIDEFTRKNFVSPEPGYAQRIEELRAAFGNGLDELARLDLTSTERRELRQLQTLWLDYLRETAGSQTLLPVEGADDPEAADQAWRAQIAALRAIREQTDRVVEASGEAVGRKVEISSRASRRASQVSWVFVGIAVALTLPVMWFTVRSIHEPLRRLTEGTRAVAEGRFLYQLDDSRSDEFAALARSFNDMVHRLRELDAVKSDFVSQVSHELKTPLVAMQETNALLLEGIPGELNEKQRRLLDLNQRSGRRLAAMISKLLDLGQLEADAVRYDLQPNDLSALTAQVVAGFEPSAAERHLRLELESPAAPVWARCDGERIKQVVHNLVENAIKFSPAGAKVHVRVLESDGSSVFRCVEVRDEGPGIADPHKEEVFEKFHQLPSGVKNDDGGVGLGLAICREIIDAHQGAVWVRDNEEGGSIFAFRLPVAEAPGEAAALGETA